MKKVIAIITSLCLLCCSVPITTCYDTLLTVDAAYEDYTINGVIYRVNQENDSQYVSVVDVDEIAIADKTDIVIEESVMGTPVTSIEYYAFKKAKNIKSVSIPASVSSIQVLAFKMCESLESYHVDSGSEYFYTDSEGIMYNKDHSALLHYPPGKPDESFTVPDTVSEIGPCAFNRSMNLKNISLHNNITKMGNSVFMSCAGLESIVIPDSITCLENSLFNGCSNLRSVTIPDSVTRIGPAAFENCDSLKSIALPDSVTSIERSAFLSSGLESFTFPKSVTKIEDDTFAYTKLRSITIPDSIESIGKCAFENCYYHSVLHVQKEI